MKFTKFRIVAESGKYYIEVPFLFFFWKKLGRWVYHEVGFQDIQTYDLYIFDNFQEANNFAAKHKYRVII